MTRLLLVATAALVATSACAKNIAVTWTIPTNPQTITAAKGDTVTFTWTGGHNVYQVADAAKITGACDFTTAGFKNLGNTSPLVFTMGETAAFFGCQVGTHCQNGQKLTVNPEPAPVAVQTAAQFCASYETTCAAVGTNFANTAACETFYTGAAAGTLANPISGTAAGNTRACYQYHLQVAGGAGNAATHCPHAKGTTLCVAAAPAAPVAQTDAEFCTLYEKTCTAEADRFSTLSQADYTAKCKAFYTGAAAGTLGNPITKTASGATRACYQYHLGAAGGAAAGSATTHCPHAKGTTLCVRAPDGAGGQIPLIASEFCAAYQKTCTTDTDRFSMDSQADYTAKCEAFYTGAAAGTLGNPITKTAAGATRACFQYHLSAAAAAGAGNAATHCPHAKGTTLCVAAAPATNTTKPAKLDGAATVTTTWAVGAASVAACLALV